MPLEPKLFVGIVEIPNTITIRISEEDSASSAGHAIGIAEREVRMLLTETFGGDVREGIDIDIHETEAFRDGE